MARVKKAAKKAALKTASYRDAGVDIDAGDDVVRRIRDSVRSTYSPQVLELSHGSFGGFFALYGNGTSPDNMRDPVLVGATDGVGTKLKIAFMTKRFDTVGIDLVAMCVNDLIVGGARPLFFLDYFATGALDPGAVEQVVAGVADGCRQAQCALLGGETAELPGFYKKGEFDLAGFSVGVVDRRRIIDGSRVRPGDVVVGLGSSGLHSNGFSLVRKVLVDGRSRKELLAVHPKLGRSLADELLEPTRIYVRSIVSLLERYSSRSPIRALAHITGGGLIENIPRVLPAGCGVELNRKAWPVPPIFALLKKQGPIAGREMDRVFNQGLGMVLVVAARNADAVVEHLNRQGEKAYVVGEVVKGAGKVRIR